MTNQRHHYGILIITLLLSLALAACGGPAAQPTDEPQPSPERQAVVGLALSTLSNPFFVSIRAGAEEAAERLDARLIVTDAQDDVEQQADQIQGLIDENIDVLLVNPVDGDAIVPSIEAASEAGVTVLTIDRSANSGNIAAHIASDNAAGGIMAADYLAELLGKSGSVVELEGIPGTSAAIDRGQGFTEGIGEYSGIEVIAHEVGNFKRDDGKRVFAQLLAEHPEIDGVFAHNDDMVLGAIEAAKEMDRADEIVFIGFDAIDDAVTALEAGELAATIAQQPAEMGRLGVEMAVKSVNGETLPEFVLVDLALLTN